MISIDFLKPCRVDGMEYVDFQNKLFAQELTELLDSHISNVDGVSVLSREVEVPLYTIINEHTGFRNIKLVIDEAFPNAGVDTGHFSPKHVLNTTEATRWGDPESTSIYRWFEANRGKMFKGSVDYKTGKVGGAFRDIPVKLYVNPNLSNFILEEDLKKFKVSIGGALGAVFCHELGHIFGGCAMVQEVFTDNVVVKMAIQQYIGTPSKETRLAIVKDAGTLLELERTAQRELNQLAEEGNEDDVTLYFTKMISRRNTNRALSLGVPAMTSEVMADAYAIRMGFGKELVAGLAGFYKSAQKDLLFTLTFIGAILTIYGGAGIITAGAAGVGVAVFYGALYAVISTLTYFGMNESDIYNSPQRRFEDALRQLIAKYKADKSLPPAAKAADISFIDDMLKLNDKMKPLMENTVVKRIGGWLISGADFKYKEMEHYTQQLNNHEINLLSGKLDSLIKR